MEALDISTQKYTVSIIKQYTASNQQTYNNVTQTTVLISVNMLDLRNLIMLSSHEFVLLKDVIPAIETL